MKFNLIKFAIFAIAITIGIATFYYFSNASDDALKKCEKSSIVIATYRDSETAENIASILTDNKVFSEVVYNLDTEELEFYSEGVFKTTCAIDTRIVLDKKHIHFVHPNGYHEYFDR